MKSPVVRVETETGHYYKNVNTGFQVPGVTTILKALPKAQLENWRIRRAVSLALKGADEWEIPEDVDPVEWLMDAGQREALVAAEAGTNVHDFAEKHMLGLNPDIEELTKTEQRHARCYLQFFENQRPDPILVEKTLVYIDPKTGIPLYCGTMDLVARLMDGNIWLCDYKASSKSPRASHALQSAAYRYATHWIDEDENLQEMVPVDKAAVILLNGGKQSGKCYRMYEVDASPVVFSVFKSLMRITNFTKVEDRVILGEV